MIPVKIGGAHLWIVSQEELFLSLILGILITLAMQIVVWIIVYYLKNRREYESKLKGDNLTLWNRYKHKI